MKLKDNLEVTVEKRKFNVACVESKIYVLSHCLLM